MIIEVGGTGGPWNGLRCTVETYRVQHCSLLIEGCGIGEKQRGRDTKPDAIYRRLLRTLDCTSEAQSIAEEPLVMSRLQTPASRVKRMFAVRTCSARAKELNAAWHPGVGVVACGSE